MKSTLKTIPLSDVLVGDRMRANNDIHVQELAESIRKEGLLQPIVLRRKDNRIIAGGHRYAAFTILAADTDIPEAERFLFSEIPFIYFDEYLRKTGRIKKGQHISDGQLMVLEMEENLKRLDMTWQEKCKGIYRYHKQQIRDNRTLDIVWMQEMTGKLLGLSQASISQNLKIGEELVKNPHSPLAKCESLADALRFVSAQKLDDAVRDRAKRIRARAAASQVATTEDDPVSEGEAPSEDNPAAHPQPDKAYPLELLASLYLQGDFRDQLPKLAETTKIDHIVCDPPYAIDMKNLDKFDSIDRIEDTHQVAPNKELLVDLLDIAFKCVSTSGFMCMWYDLDMHEMLQTTAKKIGWKVCRWPLVWCKTTPCRNSVAQYNFTKSTEVCLILRRSENAVLVEKQSNNYILAPAVSSKTHPFVKPFQVWERLIRAVSMKNQTVVDPFAGEGSCLAAALQMDRFAYGIEIDQRHVDQGISSLDRELNKASKLMHELEDETPF